MSGVCAMLRVLAPDVAEARRHYRESRKASSMINGRPAARLQGASEKNPAGHFAGMAGGGTAERLASDIVQGRFPGLTHEGFVESFSCEAGVAGLSSTSALYLALLRSRGSNLPSASWAAGWPWSAALRNQVAACAWSFATPLPLK